MSGPKVSQYELDQMRRQEEARRLEEERRRLAEIKRREEEERKERQRQNSLKEISSMRKDLRQYIQEIEKMKMNAHYMNDYLELSGKILEIDLLLSEINQGLKSFEEFSLESVLKEEKKTKSLYDKVNAYLISLHMDNREWENTIHEKLDMEVDSLFKKEHMKKVQIKDDIVPLQKENNEHELIAMTNVIFDNLESMRSNVYNDQELVKEIERAIQVLNNQRNLGNYQGILSYQGMHGEKLVYRYKENVEQYKMTLGEYKESVIQYESTCEIAGIQPRVFNEEKDLNQTTIQWIREETIRIESKILENREKEIVQDAIQEVMEELGYTIIGSKASVRRNGKRIDEKVFSYGDGTAINVIETNGQITMEVVGVDTSDRNPDEGESEFMEEEMFTFCSTFKEAEERLKDKGIVLKNRIQMMPPSKEYAQILNINDYELQTENISMIQSRSKKQRTIKDKKTKELKLN